MVAGDFPKVILLSDGSVVANQLRDHFFAVYEDAIKSTNPHDKTTLSSIWGFPICRLVHPSHIDKVVPNDIAGRTLVVLLFDHSSYTGNSALPPKTNIAELFNYNGKDLFCMNESSKSRDHDLFLEVDVEPSLLQPYSDILSSTKLFNVGISIRPICPSASLSASLPFIGDVLLAFSSPSFIQASINKECCSAFHWKMHLLRRRENEVPRLEESAKRFQCKDLALMRCGSTYFPLGPQLAQARLHGRRVCNLFVKSSESEDQLLINASLRNLLCSSQDCFITPPFQCDYGFNIYMEKAYCNYGCTFVDCGLIMIGENTMLGPNVDIYTVTHPTDPEERATLFESTAPVIIGKNCWIGGKSTIVAGIRIGDNVLVGAGSVVTKDVPDGWMVAGNPAKCIRRLGDGDEKKN